MSARKRRLLGFITGAVLGLAYSLTANLVNRLLLPSLPLQEPFPGALLLALGSSLLAGLMGLITLWSDETFIGLLVSSLLGAGIAALWSWYTEDVSGVLLMLTFFVFLPRVFFYIPLGIAVHWISRQWQRVTLADRRNPGKVIVPVVCFLAAFGAGMFSIHPPEVRYALVTTDQILQEGMAAASEDDLPEPLQDVWYFTDYARGEYTLEVSLEPDRLPVQRPIAQYGQLVSLIIVQFENGFTIGCVFTPPHSMPVCGNMP